MAATRLARPVMRRVWGLMLLSLVEGFFFESLGAKISIEFYLKCVVGEKGRE